MNDDGGAEEEHVLGAACVIRVPAGRAGFRALFGRRGRSLARAVQGVSTRSCCAQLPCVEEEGGLKGQSLCFKLSLKAEEVQ